MTYAYVILAFIVTAFAGIRTWFAYEAGKDKASLKQKEKDVQAYDKFLEELEKVNIAAADPSYDDELRAKYKVDP